MALFCIGSLIFLVVRDLALPEVRDVEVWLGIEVRGAWARWTAPVHWALFAVGAWAFAKGKPWIWQAAATYLFYVALSHLVWNLSSPAGGGWLHGLWQLALFAAIGAWLARQGQQTSSLHNRSRIRSSAARASERPSSTRGSV